MHLKCNYFLTRRVITPKLANEINILIFVSGVSGPWSMDPQGLLCRLHEEGERLEVRQGGLSYHFFNRWPFGEERH